MPLLLLLLLFMLYLSQCRTWDSRLVARCVPKSPSELGSAEPRLSGAVGRASLAARGPQLLRLRILRMADSGITVSHGGRACKAETGAALCARRSLTTQRISFLRWSPLQLPPTCRTALFLNNLAVSGRITYGRGHNQAIPS